MLSKASAPPANAQSLINDFSAWTVADSWNPLAPSLQGLGTQPRPVIDFADHAYQCDPAIGASCVAREILIGRVGVVFIRARRFYFYLVDMGDTVHAAILAASPASSTSAVN